MANKPLKVSDQSKPWNRKKRFDNPYTLHTLAPKKTFLVVCEGANTEPDYFRAIPAPNADVRFEGGHGSNTALVSRALELRKHPDYAGREVWCVYDMDWRGLQVGQREDFNRSIEMARQNGLHVAYSNDSFELWFVLHYQLVESAVLRTAYYEILEGLWDIGNYEKEGKKKAFTRSLYERLQNDPRANEKQAIAHAQHLLETQVHKPFADQNPCTTVHELMLALRG